VVIEAGLSFQKIFPLVEYGNGIDNFLPGLDERLEMLFARGDSLVVELH
jgi:hypothetical protein